MQIKSFLIGTLVVIALGLKTTVAALAKVTYITLVKGHTVSFGEQPEPTEIEQVTYVKPHKRIKRVKVNHYELGALKA